MYLIGLTGGIACGKSTVAALLAETGAFLIDADKIARSIVEPGEPAFAEILAAFGPAVLNSDGELDRKQLAEQVFSDGTKRKLLENITHPRIEEQVKMMIERAAEQGHSLVILDVPLLFESGWDQKMDEVWVVTIQDERVQLRRLQERNGFSEKEARSRMRAQLSQAEKIRRATRIIDNSGDLLVLHEKVAAVWEAALLASAAAIEQHKSTKRFF